MNLDEFAFFNQQLAAMLRTGIPLEGALAQLCASMRRGDLRRELDKVRADLANGIPLADTLKDRKLPDFYKQMLTIGAKSNDLPGVLTLVADFYQRSNLIWTRLKGLMVYPIIVLICSLALSVGMTAFVIRFLRIFVEDLFGVLRPLGQLPMWLLWAPPLLLSALVIAVLAAWAIPNLRQQLRWRVPAFREANLARIASTVAIMLRSGCTFADAVGLVRQIEEPSVATDELRNWQDKLSDGTSSFSDVAAGGRVFPGLFVWLVANAPEDLAQGFQRASEVYQTRANFRVEMMLYAALPIAILILGGLICGQLYSLWFIMSHILNSLTG